jgi:hypothetical protein
MSDMPIETAIVKLKSLSYVVVKRSTATETVYTVYEPAIDTDHSSIVRHFDTIPGPWKQFIMPLSWSTAAGSMEWALSQLAQMTKLYSLYNKDVPLKIKMTQAVKRLAEATEADESVMWASKTFFNSVEDVTRTIIVSAYPEAREATSNGSLWFRLPRKE